VFGIALVAQIAVVASAPPSVVTCTPFEISVAARAPGSVAPHIALPASAGLQLLQSHTTSRVDHFGNGEASALTEGTFLVAIGASGRVVLPPFEATAGAQRGTSGALAVELRPAEDAQPRVLVRARLDPDRDSVYVGQQLDYVVDVQLNTVARERLRRNPTFFPPEMPGVLAYDLALPPRPRRAGPRCFESLTYRRALFPLFAGTTTIAPASLTYALPVSTSFFSREESFELRTDSVRFVALDPPLDGRPAGYIGAVGQVRASARLSTTAASMGDPVVFTLRMEAVGNVKLLPRPVLDLPWASVALGDERVTVDSVAAHVHGTKEFDWLLTPRRAGRLELPSIRYVYFDPDRAEYDVALSDSLPLEVSVAALAASDSAPVARLQIRTSLREERGAPVTSRPWFWALVALALAPAALRQLRVRRRRRARRRPALRRLHALAASSNVDVREVRRTFLETLVERVPGLAADATRVPLGRSLRRAGVTDATADRTESLLAELDVAAFASNATASADLARRALLIARAADQEAVRPSAVAHALPLVVLVVLLGGLAAAATPEPLARAFAAGVDAYRHNDFAGAERMFARVSARAPRSGDAWANLAAAAWSRGDTALAAAGWQRALRLDPLDVESRDRYATLQATSLGDAAYVPPVPVDVLAIAALTLWLAAWLVMALPAAYRPQGVRSLAGSGVVLSLLFFGATFELASRSRASGLGALRSSRSLMSAPASDADAVAAATAGEVGALGAREGAWVRITVDADRAGWLPLAAVLPLDQPLQ
jgi:tetratricopeptide (TPR) repeat protein